MILRDCGKRIPETGNRKAQRLAESDAAFAVEPERTTLRRWKSNEVTHSLPASSFAAATAGQEGPAMKK